MKDFIGLDVHTVNFKPDLYRPVCQLVRDYHMLYWDIGSDPSTPTRFPMCGKVEGDWLNWGTLYGSWVKQGFTVDACVQWGKDLSPDKWTDMPKQAHAYGKSFADCFGSQGMKLVEAIEIAGGSAPDYDAKAYHTIFRNMARGIRAGDPSMKIGTCTVTVDPEHSARPLESFSDAKDLFDIINISSFGTKGTSPNVEYSYPEDPSIRYTSAIQNVINERDRNFPGKQIWLTGFGYDASSKQPEKAGDNPKWSGVTDDVQACYIVRSFLLFSALDLDRAYLFWFNDKDEPGLHSSSGITRNFIPKPSYYAMRHLYQTLGDYRFGKALRQDKDRLYAYQYVNGSDARDCLVVAWAPTEAPQPADQLLDLPVKPIRAQRMPISDGAAPAVPVDAFANGSLKLPIDGTPVYIWMRLP